MNKRLHCKSAEPSGYIKPPALADKVTAAQLQAWHDTDLRSEPLAAATSPYLLHRALIAKFPALNVSHACVKVWWQKYKDVNSDVQPVNTAQELESRHGSQIRAIATEANTSFNLCSFAGMTSPIFVTDMAAKTWLRQFGPKSNLIYIDSAGHLETLYGERIRQHKETSNIELSNEALRTWLLDVHSLSVPARTVQKWLTSEWSSSGHLLSPAAVEGSIGDRLRLTQYTDNFLSDAGLERLSNTLAESGPSIRVSTPVLQQWYSEHHPSSGAVTYETAEALEAAMGDHIRRVHPSTT